MCKRKIELDLLRSGGEPPSRSPQERFFPLFLPLSFILPAVWLIGFPPAVSPRPRGLTVSSRLACPSSRRDPLPRVLLRGPLSLPPPVSHPFCPLCSLVRSRFPHWCVSRSFVMLSAQHSARTWCRWSVVGTGRE
eukprot:scaffold170545_cov30-Tisochrysis_lutea.AAC.1